MNPIDVLAICGKVCVNPLKGVALNKVITDQLRLTKTEIVRVNFAGVTTVTSSFLNYAIGALYREFEHGELRRRLTFEGLDETDKHLLLLVQNNAKRFYMANTALRIKLARADDQLLTLS